VTRGHKRKQRLKLGLFIAAIGLSVAALIGGISFNAAAAESRRGNYEELLSSRDLNNYYEAADIYPGNVDAYNKMLDAYDEKGMFTEEDSRYFEAKMGAAVNSGAFNENDPEVAELRYRAGLLYLSFYSKSDGSTSFADRNNKAYTHFAANAENEQLPDFEHAELSECFYQICAFNKRFKTSSASMAEANHADYEALLETLERIKPILESSSENNQYNRLTYYSTVFELLYDQRGGLASQGIPLETVLGLFDEAYESATGLSVQKPVSVEMQNMMVKNYEGWRDEIIKVYNNRGGVSNDG
jgi:serine/threonine-protein kinase